MKTKRWTLGVVLAAAVSLWGLIQADASPFSAYILTDDLDNSVHGSAPEADSWGDESGSADEGSSSGDSAQGGDGNNGHGNNADGVDSSNPSQGKGGPNGAVDESCDGTGECIDDEVKGGNSTSDSGSDSSDSDAKTNNGKGKNK